MHIVKHFRNVLTNMVEIKAIKYNISVMREEFEWNYTSINNIMW